MLRFLEELAATGISFALVLPFTNLFWVRVGLATKPTTGRFRAWRLGREA